MTNKPDSSLQEIEIPAAEKERIEQEAYEKLPVYKKRHAEPNQVTDWECGYIEGAIRELSRHLHPSPSPCGWIKVSDRTPDAIESPSPALPIKEEEKYFICQSEEDGGERCQEFCLKCSRIATPISRIEKEQGEELTEDNTVELKHLNLLSAAVNDKDKLWAWERIAIYYQNKIQSLTAENTALQKVVSQVIAQNESLCEERDRYSVSWEEREKIMTGVEKERDEYRCMLGKILWANYVAPDSVKNILDKYPPK
jgi:hypothetical protein